MASDFPRRLASGWPYPLGASWDGLGINFAVFSAHAERVDLCLFDSSGRREITQLTLPECTDAAERTETIGRAGAGRQNYHLIDGTPGRWGAIRAPRPALSRRAPAARAVL